MFSIIRSVMYGRRVPQFEAPEIVQFFAVLEKWNQLVEPGATPPLEMIPLLKLVPARWARWKRDGARVRALQRELYFGWLEETKEKVRRGEGNGSYMEEVLRRREELGMDDEMAALSWFLQGVARYSLYPAGTSAAPCSKLGLTRPRLTCNHSSSLWSAIPMSKRRLTRRLIVLSVTVCPLSRI